MFTELDQAFLRMMHIDKSFDCFRTSSIFHEIWYPRLPLYLLIATFHRLVSIHQLVLLRLQYHLIQLLNQIHFPPLPQIRILNVSRSLLPHFLLFIFLLLKLLFQLLLELHLLIQHFRLVHSIFMITLNVLQYLLHHTLRHLVSLVLLLSFLFILTQQMQSCLFSSSSL